MSIETGQPATGTTVVDGCGGKYLAFFLADREYGIEILRVREIIGVMQITPVPGTPECIRGVINLRGRVIPILDLRWRFELSAMEATDENCIIVVQRDDDMVGVLVDRVSEVIDIPSADIDEPPSFGGGLKADYILGVGKAEDHVRLLLDMDRVLKIDTLADFLEDQVQETT